MITPRVFRALPGNVWVRASIMALIVIAIVVVLFEVVFPWVATVIPYQEQTVE